MHTVAVDIRNAADDIMTINRAIHQVLERAAQGGLQPSDLVLLASAAELAEDRAAIITDCCRRL